MPVVIVAIVIIVFLLLIFLFFRKSGTTADAHKHHVKEAPRKIKDKADDILPKQLHDADVQQKMLHELFPSLKEITYFSIPEGVFPTPIEHIDELLPKTIQEKIGLIKPIPTNSANLLNMLRNPESHPREISAIVSTNPVFSAKILQTVNSAYFGLNNKITSLGRAITLLGYNNVRTLIFEDSLKKVMPIGQDDKSEMYVNIWIHSAIVSVCAGYLGKKIFQFSEYDLATMGLLHDIGKYCYHLLEIQGEAAPDLPSIIQEEQKYSINHATLGSLIARNWQLSESIVQSIAYHHYPSFLLPESIPPAFLKESFIISLSDLIVKALGYKGQGDDILPIKEEYFNMFHLSSMLPGMITPSLIKDIEKTRLTVESYVKVTAADAV
ncbi:MAG: HDOD domain-containing protein [Proteobacteria bacterium]|nr:HDOD domain-containing protein [Pseudomonadota bacterium]